MSDAIAIRILNAFMISKTNSIKAVIAKCKGMTKNANGAADTLRRARIIAESIAYSAAIAPTRSGGPPKATPSTNMRVARLISSLPASSRKASHDFSGLICFLSRICNRLMFGFRVPTERRSIFSKAPLTVLPNEEVTFPMIVKTARFPGHACSVCHCPNRP